MLHDLSSSTIGPFGEFDDLSGYCGPEESAAFVLFAVAISSSFTAEPEERDALTAVEYELVRREKA
jgi:hypothetical protein